MENKKKRVVILGAGYAGIRVALDVARARARGLPLEVVLVSDRANHIDTPALYEVATAYLHRESSASSEVLEEGVGVPLQTILRGQPVRLLIRTIRDINPAERFIVDREGATMSYDILVIATGATVATYGVAGIAEHAFSVKTISEALELRHHIVRQFMMAKKLAPEERGATLSFAVVGAGATGVETAAELCGQIRALCARHQIEATCPRVFLIEANDDILATASPAGRHYAKTRLKQLGVEIMTGRAITDIRAHGVVLRDGSAIPATTVIWTGGLKVSPVLTGAQLPLAAWGVACENTLQVQGHPTIFAAGDAAILVNYPEKIPGVVPVAYTQGALVAENIVRQVEGRPLQEYRYSTLGAVITVGGKKAVAQLPRGRELFGFKAWGLKKIISLRYWLSLLPMWSAFSFWRQSIKLHSMND